jgi:hypothetical protein
MTNRFGAAGTNSYPATTTWAFFEHHRIKGDAHRATLLGQRPLDKTDGRSIRRWHKGGRANGPHVHRLLAKYGFSVEYFQRWCRSRNLTTA